MENSIQNFAESLDDTQLEHQQSYFISQDADPGPGDEDEGEDEGEEENEGDAKGEGEGEGDDNPPLDPDVVHSPVRTQTGGKPR